MSGLVYPSKSVHHNYSIDDLVLSADISSRATYCYILLALAGLTASVFILITFITGCKGGKSLTKVDTFFFALSLSDLFIMLFSISVIAHRPDYFKTTSLNCGVLSFFFNISYFNSQFLQVTMLFFLTFEENSPGVALLIKALDNALACVGLTALGSFLGSVFTTALLEMGQQRNESLYCQLDPLQAGPRYDIAKFIVGIALPCLLLTLLLVKFLLLWKKSETGMGLAARLKACSAFLAVASVTLVCRIFYNAVLLHRTSLKYGLGSFSPQHEALGNVAELVMFSGSCLSLVLIVSLHKLCREGMVRTLKSMTDPCRRIGRGETHRNIMTPTIEIAEHKEETVSLYSENQGEVPGSTNGC
ncbi:hypothetical protein EOD39_0233 [Acipenser ruthenus]|uniref:G-protein coupled receptors family 1 profile domain-containing protein n=1 Tax=Acipenser ruthenus TaxID=7906 RepID=A0A444UBF4_ACIRT|nr:uncharacterized protein LOC117418155 [Acipenser ruthenus]RXM32479.1 hypothetical protein EOD39_0233 [Acipenser ruthenus]